ncbi:unnamed protein product, partial [Didymodactylos carnosus]
MGGCWSFLFRANESNKNPNPLPDSVDRYQPEPNPNHGDEKIRYDRRNSDVSIYFQETHRKLQLMKPIYVAVYPYQSSHSTDISFDEGDEFELIKDKDDLWLHVKHLRSSNTGYIPKSYVNLDETTPLRLVNNDRGIAEVSLLKYNIPYAYMVRRSDRTVNAYVLSVRQSHERLNVLVWHYLIRVDTKNRYFYFEQETALQHKKFTSFHQLVTDPDVLRCIPLSEPISATIECEDELWKIEHHELKLIKMIGTGQFGEVWSGQWKQTNSETIQVAIKKLKFHDSNTSNEFAREIQAMKNLRNNYIVSLFGVSKDPKTNETLMITEFMINGDLKSWLKMQEIFPGEHIIIDYAKQIIRGMTYLEHCNYIHRDLACRNILLGRQNNIKIADFGLSTIINGDEVERRRAGDQKLPFRWSAPEVLEDRTKYSIQSDIWSFGVVLIEMWLKGDDPYPEKHAMWIIDAVKH